MDNNLQMFLAMLDEQGLNEITIIFGQNKYSYNDIEENPELFYCHIESYDQEKKIVVLKA